MIMKWINWGDLYTLGDANLAQDFLESSLSNVLREVAPIVKVQPKKCYRKSV